MLLKKAHENGKGYEGGKKPYVRARLQRQG